MLDPYFSATKAAWLLTESGLALDPADPDLSVCTVDSWILWNLTGGTAGGTYATDPSNASRTLLFDTEARAWSCPELCALFGVPARTLAEVRPWPAASAPPPERCRVDVPHPASPLGDAGDPAGHALRQCARARHGQGDVRHRQLLLGRRRIRPPSAPDGLTVSCAWDLGDHVPAPARLAYALRAPCCLRRRHPVVARRLGIIAEASKVGPLAASVLDSGGVVFVPALTGLGSPRWDPQARGIITGLTAGAGWAQLPGLRS